MNTTWQRFEQVAQAIQSELAPSATITRGEKLRGKSSVLHQCDVVVRSKVGQFDFLCVLECKDLTEKVGLDVVRRFAARLDDLDASQGVLVSARGFTDDALTFARASGILTYTLLDAESAKWGDAAIVPVVAMFIWLMSCEARLTSVATGQVLPFQASRDLSQIPMIELATNRRLTLKTYLEERWDEVCCQPVITEPRQHMDSTGNYAVVERGAILPVRSAYRLVPGFMYYYGYIPLRIGRGFVDAGTGGVLLSGEFETEIINFHDIRSTWPQVENEGDGPIKRPVLKLYTPILFNQPENPIDGIKVEAKREKCSSATT